MGQRGGMVASRIEGFIDEILHFGRKMGGLLDFLLKKRE